MSEDNQEADGNTPNDRKSADSPLVFISHDSRDADLAEAFSHLLTDASGGIVKSFRSSDRKGTAGIEFGDEWYRAIMSKLDNATDVVALLTARSINRPWILYEAGVAKGKLASPVSGLALGVSLEDAVSGPFAQFQNSSDDEDSITKLVLQLIRKHPEADPREEAVRRQVQAFREKLETLLVERKDEPDVADKPGDTSVAKLFEEVKVLVRDMPHRVAVEVADDHPSRVRKRRKFHPSMMEDILRFSHKSGWRESSGIGILIAFSVIKDDFPWLYDLAYDLYRTIRDGSPKKIEMTRRQLVAAMEMSRNSHLMDYIDAPYDEEMLMYLSHFMHDLEHMLERPSNSDMPPDK